MWNTACPSFAIFFFGHFPFSSEWLKINEISAQHSDASLIFGVHLESLEIWGSKAFPSSATIICRKVAQNLMRNHAGQCVPFFYSLAFQVWITWWLLCWFFDKWTSLPITIMPSGLFSLLSSRLFFTFWSFFREEGIQSFEYVIKDGWWMYMWIHGFLGIQVAPEC